MCLLIFAWQAISDHPLVVAANRDERLDRPAEPMSVLRQARPRVVGGRDGLAGGTWLAVNELGVVAGLTNRPSPKGRDPSKRSRGELPLLATHGDSAVSGVEALARRVRPGQYNPAWMLVGDRRRLFYVEVAPESPPRVEELAPGIHVLENVALDAPSWKTRRVRTLLTRDSPSGDDLPTRMPSVLSDHLVPSDQEAELDVDLQHGGQGDAVVRSPATLAACVHTDEYGTRSAALVQVPARPEAPPELWASEGPSCTVPFMEKSSLWWDVETTG